MRKKTFRDKVDDFIWDHQFLVTVLAFLAVILLLVFVMAAFENWGNSISCTSRWEQSYQPEYSPFSGCLIVVDGHRIPASNYRIM